MKKQKIENIIIASTINIIIFTNFIISLIVIMGEMMEDLRFSCQEGGCIQQGGCILQQQRSDIRQITQIPTITVIAMGIITRYLVYINKTKTKNIQ